MTQSKLPQFDAEKMLEMSIGKKASPHGAAHKIMKTYLFPCWHLVNGQIVRGWKLNITGIYFSRN